MMQHADIGQDSATLAQQHVSDNTEDFRSSPRHFRRGRRTHHKDHTLLGYSTTQNYSTPRSGKRPASFVMPKRRMTLRLRLQMCCTLRSQSALPLVYP